MDALTKRWIRNSSDEAALAQGARFDLKTASYFIWWVERHCRLYEGEQAGQALVMASYVGQPQWEVPDVFDWSDPKTIELYTNRCIDHLDHLESGHHMDWQYECHMRIYGWQMFSKHFNRWVRRFREATMFVAKKNKKMNHPDEPVPTPDGWKRFGDLRVGDVVFDRHGNQCQVIKEHSEAVCDEDAFEVEFTNGEIIRCNGDHLWYTESLLKNAPMVAANKWSGPKSTALGKGRRGYYPGVRTTWEIARTLKRHDGALNHRIPMHQGLECDAAGLLLHPYMLGYWLGDGDSDCQRITVGLDDVFHLLQWADENGFTVQNCKQNDEGNYRVTFDYPIAREKVYRSEVNGFRITLDKLGLLNNKRIPRAYLRASLPQRIELLQGLMDTDGCAAVNGRELVWSQKSNLLADDFAELLASLGIKFSRKTVTTHADGKPFQSNRFQFSVARDYLEAFKLPRKLDRQLPTGQLFKMISQRSRHVHIKDVRRCAPFKSRCITVNSPGGTYLIGKTMVPTHNSPTMAANAFYLTCGDGEQGANTFFLAKTGKQAREIVGKHLHEMWKRAIEFAEQSKYNQVEHRLYFMPTSSTISTLSSDNEHARDANEGRNGNTLVDELHVVDRRTVSVIDRAGISRAEPLHMEFSTAGKDNTGYGRERFDQASAIQNSEEINIHMFAAVYAADQAIQAHEVNEKNVLEIAKKANPALGHTIDPAELVADYVKSKRFPHKMRDFMMYRLNIWQQEGLPGVPYTAWEKCATDFSFEDFHGAECDCALDMAVNTDLVAFAFNFRRDGRPWIWLEHWLPRAKALEYNEKIPILEWEKQGWIRLQPGNMIDEEAVFDDIMTLAEHVRIKTIAFDPNRARYVRMKLEAAGFPMELFRQNNREWHPCVERWERLVIGDEKDKQPRLHHPSNPLLNFQVKHHTIDEDRFSYKRIVKPASGEHKKVDGLQAMVMTMRAMDNIEAPQFPSAYADLNAPWHQVF